MRENIPKINSNVKTKKTIYNKKSSRKKSKDHRHHGQSFSPKKDLFFGPWFPLYPSCFFSGNIFSNPNNTAVLPAFEAP